MPVKYFCPKCERRFVDWGAEKLGYLCPSCEGEKLRLVGSKDDESAAAPSLKRKTAKKAAARRPSKKTVSPESILDNTVLADDVLENPAVVGLPEESVDDDVDVLAADGGSGAFPGAAVDSDPIIPVD